LDFVGDTVNSLGNAIDAAGKAVVNTVEGAADGKGFFQLPISTFIMY
jgi:hypothetical protein